MIFRYYTAYTVTALHSIYDDIFGMHVEAIHNKACCAPLLKEPSKEGDR
jgi:hypothetical protein